MDQYSFYRGINYDIVSSESMRRVLPFASYPLKFLKSLVFHLVKCYSDNIPRSAVSQNNSIAKMSDKIVSEMSSVSGTVKLGFQIFCLIMRPNRTTLGA